MNKIICTVITEDKKTVLDHDEIIEKVSNLMYDFIMLCVNVPLHYLLSGLTLKMLWEMLIVPQFPLDALSLTQIIGVLIVIQFLKKRKPTEAEMSMSYLERFVRLTIWCGLMLMIGFVASLFI